MKKTMALIVGAILMLTLTILNVSKIDSSAPSSATLSSLITSAQAEGEYCGYQWLDQHTVYDNGPCDNETEYTYSCGTGDSYCQEGWVYITVVNCVPYQSGALWEQSCSK